MEVKKHKDAYQFIEKYLSKAGEPIDIKHEPQRGLYQHVGSINVCGRDVITYIESSYDFPLAMVFVYLPFEFEQERISELYELINAINGCLTVGHYEFTGDYVRYRSSAMVGKIKPASWVFDQLLTNAGGSCSDIEITAFRQLAESDKDLEEILDTYQQGLFELPGLNDNPAAMVN